MNPIEGVRYKCAECQDYDLCENCEANNVHGHHVFLKVKNHQHINIVSSVRTDGPPNQEEPTEASSEASTERSQPDSQPQIPGIPNLDVNRLVGLANNFMQANGLNKGGKNKNIEGMIKNFCNMMKNPEDCQAFKPQPQPSQPESPKKSDKNDKRPVVLDKPEGLQECVPEQYTFLDVTIQNQSKWKCDITRIAKVGGSEDFFFAPVPIEMTLGKQEQQTVTIPVQMPSTPGQYNLKLAFYGKKGNVTGQPLEFNFCVCENDGTLL